MYVERHLIQGNGILWCNQPAWAQDALWSASSHISLYLELVGQSVVLRYLRYVRKVPGCSKCLPHNTWKTRHEQGIIKFQRTPLKRKRHNQTHFADGKRETCLFSAGVRSPTVKVRDLSEVRALLSK